MSQTFFVVDDHDSVLEGTCSVLQAQYPDAKIITASTADKVETLIDDSKPSLIVMDLSIPATAGETSKTENGINLLEDATDQVPKAQLRYSERPYPHAHSPKASN